jgi:Ca2+-binding RTX toxin-like protein
MMFESLEGRQLLSGVIATQVGGTVTYQLPGSGAAIHVIEIGHVVFAQDASLNQVGPTFVNVDQIVIAGGAGNDIIHYSGDTVPATITGGAGDDIIVVDSQVGAAAPTSLIDGGDGNDLIVVNQGGVGDTILGGNGNDTLASASGVDQFLDGGNGSDTILDVVDTTSTVTGGNGKDFVAVVTAGNPVTDTTLTSNGTDTVVTVIAPADNAQVLAITQQITTILGTLPV